MASLQIHIDLDNSAFYTYDEQLDTSEVSRILSVIAEHVHTDGHDGGPLTVTRAVLDSNGNQVGTSTLQRDL